MHVYRNMDDKSQADLLRLMIGDCNPLPFAPTRKKNREFTYNMIKQIYTHYLCLNFHIVPLLTVVGHKYVPKMPDVIQ
jgi:hypothetical protein